MDDQQVDGISSLLDEVNDTLNNLTSDMDNMRGTLHVARRSQLDSVGEQVTVRHLSSYMQDRASASITHNSTISLLPNNSVHHLTSPRPSRSRESSLRKGSSSQARTPLPNSRLALTMLGASHCGRDSDPFSGNTERVLPRSQMLKPTSKPAPRPRTHTLAPQAPPSDSEPKIPSPVPPQTKIPVSRPGYHPRQPSPATPSVSPLSRPPYPRMPSTALESSSFGAKLVAPISPLPPCPHMPRLVSASVASFQVPSPVPGVLLGPEPAIPSSPPLSHPQMLSRTFVAAHSLPPKTKVPSPPPLSQAHRLRTSTPPITRLETFPLVSCPQNTFLRTRMPPASSVSCSPNPPPLPVMPGSSTAPLQNKESGSIAEEGPSTGGGIAAAGAGGHIVYHNPPGPYKDHYEEFYDEDVWGGPASSDDESEKERKQKIERNKQLTATFRRARQVTKKKHFEKQQGQKRKFDDIRTDQQRWGSASDTKSTPAVWPRPLDGSIDHDPLWFWDHRPWKSHSLAFHGNVHAIAKAKRPANVKDSDLSLQNSLRGLKIPSTVGRVQYVSFTREDLKRLNDGMWLNDNCIVAGIWMSVNHPLQVLPDSVWGDVYICDALVGRSIMASDTGVSGVLKDGKVFMYKWILVPVNKLHSDHWTLWVVQNPAGMLSETKDVPCVYHFDSLGTADKGDWNKISLWMHPAARQVGKQIVRELRKHEVMVPRQPNSIDCGLYTIYFARAVVESPSWVIKMVASQSQVMSCKEELALRQKWYANDLSGLRRWMKETLTDWLRHGVPDRSSEIPMDVDG